MNRRKHFIFYFFYSLKTSNFHFLKNYEELEGIELDLMNFFTKISKIPLYIYSFILKERYNVNIVIK